MKKVLIASCLATLAASQLASAITVSSAVGAGPSGVNYLTFDALVLTPPVGAGPLIQVAQNTAGSLNPLGTVGVAITADGGVVVNGASGLYAPPVLSGGQGANFDGQPDGVDTTRYLTSGRTPSPGGSVTLTFGSDQNYLGLLWGSVDLYNTLTFKKGAAVVGTVTGVMVNALASGSQAAGGTFYVNITDVTFDSVVATSSSYAFEFDNVSYSTTNPLPDAGSTTGMLGLALFGLGIWARRR